jgi:hypothetical protein
MSSQKRERSGVLYFFLGFFFGAVVFALIAAIATLIAARLPASYCPTGGFSSGSACIPAVEFALLRAASWGPAAVLPLADPTMRFTQIQLQAGSALGLAILGAVLFVLPPSQARVEIFLGLFALLIGLTAFVILMVIVT